jgi:hypothetical protein
MLPASAWAFCGHYVGGAGAELYNDSSQVAIVRQANHTTLTLANDVQGNVSDFALVIPVPVVLQESDVAVVDGGLFERLDGYSSPRLVSYSCDELYPNDEFDSSGTDDDNDGLGSSAEGVGVEASFSVGEYDIVVLSATESGALISWLESNGYAVSGAAQGLLGEYIASGSYFFAAKVNLEAVPEGRAFLSPLQFAYDAEVVSLPIRLGTLSSRGVQDLIVYALNPQADGRLSIANYPEIELETECLFDATEFESFGAFYEHQFAAAMEGSGAGWATEYAWAPAWCDPCSGDPLTDDVVHDMGFEGGVNEAFFSRLHMRYTPMAASQDLVFYNSGIQDTYQVRYIDYTDECLLDSYPACEAEYVADDGSPDLFDDDRAVVAGECGCTSSAAPLAVLWLPMLALFGRRQE